MTIRKCWVLFAVFSAFFLMTGCGRAPEKRFELKGKVVSINKAQRQVTIDHEQIPGFMDAMTMPYSVREDWVLEALAPGQTIQATLVVQGDRSWIEGIRISQSAPGGRPETAVAMPGIGEDVPDFKLVNQDTAQIHLAQYRGRPLLLTFIYTRCPLPDYCPRTSRNFSEVYRGLKSVAKAGQKPHLLTVSFDTEYDTPAVLREYARRYMNPPDFGAWEFATGSPEDIKNIAGHFGLIYRKESGQITHSLVTALIGADGKLKQIFQGNEWTPSLVLNAFRSLAP
jgi:protein SCO1/2